MLMASMPITVIMQERIPAHPWASPFWTVAGIAGRSDDHVQAPVRRSIKGISYLFISSLRLELHRDEDDGYFENWAAPEPKVFVMWQMLDALPKPVLASVSYGEGTRILDSGECAEGVVMPAEVYDWLTAYLQMHYQPKPRRERRFDADTG